MPGGAKVWRLRYRVGGRGSKQEKITLGDYPAYSLADARSWRDDCKALAGRGLSPMALKRGDQIPDDSPSGAKELAQLFIRNWCLKAIEKAKVKEEVQKADERVEAFARRWYTEIVVPSNSNPRNIKRVLEKDVIPVIGSKQVADVTVADILAITDKIKNRGADQMALQTRNVLKRLFAYLQQFHPDGRALCFRIHSPGQTQPPQALHQHIRKRGEVQAQLVGTQRRCAGAVGEQPQLLLLDAVFHLAAGTVQGSYRCLAPPRWRGRLVTTKRGFSLLGRYSALPMTRRSHDQDEWVR